LGTRVAATPRRNCRTSAKRIRQIGGRLNLFFGFFSKAGTWSSAEIADWQRAAGLVPRRPMHMAMVPDLALHVAQKPR